MQVRDLTYHNTKNKTNGNSPLFTCLSFNRNLKYNKLVICFEKLLLQIPYDCAML